MNRTVKRKFIQSREKALKNTGGDCLRAPGKLLLQMYPVTRKRFLRLLTGQLLSYSYGLDQPIQGMDCIIEYNKSVITERY